MTLARAATVASLLALFAFACGDDDNAPLTDAQDAGTDGTVTDAGSPADAEADAVFDLGRPTATKTTLAAVTAAENQTLTADGRHFVTGDEGIYELVPDGKGGASATLRAPASGCRFGGITEIGDVLYANCFADGDSYLYAAKRSAEPAFQRIHTMTGIRLANGLTHDPSGHLYVACTYVGRILRLTPSSTDPLAIATQETWLDGAGVLTNGIAFADGSIYWSEGSDIKRVPIGADGKAGTPTPFATNGTAFDDIAVEPRAVFATDFLQGSVRVYDPSGTQIAATQITFAGPSSVRRAPAFGAGAFVITERNGNAVSLLTVR